MQEQLFESGGEEMEMIMSEKQQSSSWEDGYGYLQISMRGVMGGYELEWRYCQVFIFFFFSAISFIFFSVPP